MNKRWGLVLWACLGCGDDEHSTRDAALSDARVAIVDAGPDATTDAAPAPTDAGADATVAALEDLRTRNGTRLKRVALEAANTVPLYLGTWFDTQLGAECSFALDDQGVRRCLPLSQQAPEFYLDPSCTERVYSVTASACSGEPPLKFVAGDSTGCARGPVHTLLPAPTDLATRALYRRQPVGGGCVASSADSWYRDAIPKNDNYVLGPKVDNATFARVTSEDERSDGTPSVRWLVAEDGARETAAYYGKDGAWCTPTHAAGGVDLCLPPLAQPAQAWSDATCTTQLLEPAGLRCRAVDPGPPKVQLGACAAGACFYSVEAYSGGAFVKATANVCSADASSPAPLRYVRGVELPRSGFEPLQVRSEPTARIEVRSTLDDRGRRIEVDVRGLRDGKLGYSCQLGATIDGQFYCLPAPFASLVYRDASCTSEAIAVAGSEPALGQVVACRDEYTGAACTPIRIFKLGERVQAGSRLWQKVSTGCSEIFGEGRSVYTYASELSPSELVRFERTH